MYLPSALHLRGGCALVCRWRTGSATSVFDTRRTLAKSRRKPVCTWQRLQHLEHRASATALQPTATMLPVCLLIAVFCCRQRVSDFLIYLLSHFILSSASLLRPFWNHLVCFRSTVWQSRPNKTDLKCQTDRTYVRASVRPSTSFFDFNEIWHVGRGRWLMHDGMQYDPWKLEIRPFSKPISFAIYNGSWQLTTDT